MARFRRRSFKRRNSLKRKRRSFRNKRGRTFKKRVKRVIQQTAEKKFIDVYSSRTVSGSISGTFDYLAPTIAQGTTVSTRVGIQVTGRSLKLNLLFIANGSSTLITRVKIIVGTWRDYQVSSPTSAILLSNDSLQQISFNVREDLQNKEWTPMYQRDIMLANNGEDNFYPAQKLIKLSFTGKKLPHKKRTFNSGGLADNQYFLYLQTDQAVNPPVCYYGYRYTYTDV